MMSFGSQALLQRCDDVFVLLAGVVGMRSARRDFRLWIRKDCSTAGFFWGSCAVVAACVCVWRGGNMSSPYPICGGRYVPGGVVVLSSAGVLLLLLLADIGGTLARHTPYSLSFAV